MLCSCSSGFAGENQTDHEVVQYADRGVMKSMDTLAQSHVTVRESPATET